MYPCICITRSPSLTPNGLRKSKEIEIEYGEILTCPNLIYDFFFSHKGIKLLFVVGHVWKANNHVRMFQLVGYFPFFCNVK